MLEVWQRNYALPTTLLAHGIDTIPQEVAKNIKNFTKSIDFLWSDEYNEHCIGGRGMKISYKKLWILLIEKEVSPATLRKDLNIATGTMTKMRRNEEVALSVLLRICEYLDCNIGDICDAVKEECDF